MAVFVLTPVLEEVEDREDLAVGVLLEVAVDGDVAPVANLFGEIGGVEDELRLEERVGLVGGQEAEIELNAKVTHGFVEEAGVTGFIACHVGKALGQQRVFLLDPAAELLVEQEARKLRGAALLEEFHEHAACFWIELVGRTIKRLIADEVVAVVVLAELLANRFQLLLIGPQIHGGHRFKISRVEARRQDRVLHRILDGWLATRARSFGDRGGGDHPVVLC